VRAAYERATVLELGARGVLDGAPFTLAGRTCVRGRRGAIWNEWRLSFEDGRSLFLVESPLGLAVYDEGTLTPAFASVTVGAPLDTGFVVVDRGEATRVAQWGDVEDAPSRYAYADLSSRAGAVATIDFGAASGPSAGGGDLSSSPPRVYVGRKVGFAEVGLSPVSACEPLLIRAPEVSRPAGVETWLEIGDEGELDGVRFRVAGVLGRCLDVGTDERVSWEEYLLVARGVGGVRWLVVASGHWSFVEPVEAGLVGESEASASLDGVVYDFLSEGTARVEWAAGDLPWEVAIGDASSVKDFVHAPWVLTKEWTSDELTWSRAIHVRPDAIAKAFGKRSLPRPRGRAPNEP